MEQGEHEEPGAAGGDTHSGVHRDGQVHALVRRRGRRRGPSTRSRCRRFGNKGHHTIVFRTLFGNVSIESPRLRHCPCRPRENATFSVDGHLVDARFPRIGLRVSGSGLEEADRGRRHPRPRREDSASPEPWRGRMTDDEYGKHPR